MVPQGSSKFYNVASTLLFPPVSLPCLLKKFTARVKKVIVEYMEYLHGGSKLCVL